MASNWSSMLSLGKDIKDRIAVGLQDLENQANLARQQRQSAAAGDRLAYQPRAATRSPSGIDKNASLPLPISAQVKEAAVRDNKDVLDHSANEVLIVEHDQVDPKAREESATLAQPSVSSSAFLQEGLAMTTDALQAASQPETPTNIPLAVTSVPSDITTNDSQDWNASIPASQATQLTIQSEAPTQLAPPQLPPEPNPDSELPASSAAVSLEAPSTTKSTSKKKKKKKTKTAAETALDVDTTTEELKTKDLQVDDLQVSSASANEVLPHVDEDHPPLLPDRYHSQLKSLLPENCKDHDSLIKFIQDLVSGRDANIAHLEAVSRDMRDAQEKMDILQSQMREKHLELDQRNRLLQEQLDQTKNSVREMERELMQSRQAHQSALDNMRNSHADKVKDLEKEIERTKEMAKEEEERRMKSFSLLKALRQKTVKLEKERDDALVEKEKALEEISTAKIAAAELQTRSKEAIKDKQDKCQKDLAAAKSEHALDMTSQRNASRQELELRDQKIVQLQSQLKNLEETRAQLFNQTQLQEADVDRHRRQVEMMQSELGEFRFRGQDSAARIAVLEEELAVLSEQLALAEQVVASKGSIDAELADREAQATRELDNMRQIHEEERLLWERSEAEYSRRLDLSSKELDKLRDLIEEKTQALTIATMALADKGAALEKSQEREDVSHGRLQAALTRLEVLQSQRAATNDSVGLPLGQAMSADEQTNEIPAINSKTVTDLEELLRQTRSRLLTSQNTNKSLREELQQYASKAVSDRITNPASINQLNGVGDPTDPSLEYLRNVILQFLEHREMRGQLTQVLTMLLQFNPAQVRRLQAKLYN